MGLKVLTTLRMSPSSLSGSESSCTLILICTNYGGCAGTVADGVVAEGSCDATDSVVTLHGNIVRHMAVVNDSTALILIAYDGSHTVIASEGGVGDSEVLDGGSINVAEYADVAGCATAYGDAADGVVVAIEDSHKGFPVAAIIVRSYADRGECLAAEIKVGSKLEVYATIVLGVFCVNDISLFSIYILSICWVMTKCNKYVAKI